jgi:hypothetical protein
MSDPALTAVRVEALLKDWQRLNTELMSLSASGVTTLLEAEVTGRCRPSWIVRIYGRYSRLRHDAEQSQLLRGIVPWRNTEWHENKRRQP